MIAYCTTSMIDGRIQRQQPFIYGNNLIKEREQNISLSTTIWEMMLVRKVTKAVAVMPRLGQ